MTANIPVPEFPNRDSAREWMRQVRGALPPDDRAPSATPEEFAETQRSRLLQTATSRSDRGVRRRIEIALTGELTDDNSIPVSTLGSFLTNFQESVSAVAQALTGRPTISAAIPREVRAATALSAAATFPSSFGVAMDGPSFDVDDNDLFAGRVGKFRTILDDSVERVLDIVDLSEGAGSSDEMLAEQLAPLGQRSMKHIGNLTTGLGNAGIGTRIVWHVPGRRPRRSTWSAEGVRRVRELCEQSTFADAERTTVTGLLGSASAFRSRVEIRTDSGEILQAGIGEELTGRLGNHFNKRVEADVEVTRVRFSGGRERSIYYILELRNM